MSKRQSQIDRSLLEMARRDDSELWDLARLIGQVEYKPALPLLLRMYELMDGTEGRPDMRTFCLEKIGCVGGKKARAFLLDELTKHKGHSALGDWAIVGLCRSNSESQSDADLFLQLLDDPEASVQTKHSAVHGLSNIASNREWGERFRLSDSVVARMIKATEFALFHDHPEMRIAAIWLARLLNVFRDRVVELSLTDTRKSEVTTVAREAQIHLEGWNPDT